MLSHGCVPSAKSHGAWLGGWSMRGQRSALRPAPRQSLEPLFVRDAENERAKHTHSCPPLLPVKTTSSAPDRRALRGDTCWRESPRPSLLFLRPPTGGKTLHPHASCLATLSRTTSGIAHLCKACFHAQSMEALQGSITNSRAMVSKAPLRSMYNPAHECSLASHHAAKRPLILLDTAVPRPQVAHCVSVTCLKNAGPITVFKDLPCSFAKEVRMMISLVVHNSLCWGFCPCRWERLYRLSRLAGSYLYVKPPPSQRRPTLSPPVALPRLECLQASSHLLTERGDIGACPSGA